MEELLRSAAQKLLKGSLQEAAFKLLEHPVFLRELRAIDNYPPMVAFIERTLPQLCETYTNGVKFESSVMDSLSECGGVLSPYVTTIIRNYKARTKRTDAPSPYCPFYEAEGKFFLTCDEKRSPIFNGWDVVELSVWIYPLPQQKQDEYKLFAPYQKYIQKFWQGVSKSTSAGDLCPPYHSMLICKIQYDEIVRWIAYDCGKDGIGFVAPVESSSDGLAPIEILLKEHSHHAQCIHRYFPVDKDELDSELGFPSFGPYDYGSHIIDIHYVSTRVRLYDLLVYGVTNAEPISLKWHLDKYKDNVIEAIDKFLTKTCFGFVFGVLCALRLDDIDSLHRLYSIDHLEDILKPREIEILPWLQQNHHNNP